MVKVVEMGTMKRSKTKDIIDIKQIR